LFGAGLLTPPKRRPRGHPAHKGFAAPASPR
jgi:hypothetical protein